MDATPGAKSSLVDRANALKAASPRNKYNPAGVEARRAIEDRCGLVVQDANIVLRADCPNIDLVVFAHEAPVYVQVRVSEEGASKNCVTISNAPWTEEELRPGAPIFNQHDGWQAGLIMILDRVSTDQTDYYFAPPDALERLIRLSATRQPETAKRDRQRRTLALRKDLPKDMLRPWRDAWHLLEQKAHRTD